MPHVIFPSGTHFQVLTKLLGGPSGSGRCNESTQLTSSSSVPLSSSRNGFRFKKPLLSLRSGRSAQRTLLPLAVAFAGFSFFLFFLPFLSFFSRPLGR